MCCWRIAYCCWHLAVDLCPDSVADRDNSADREAVLVPRLHGGSEQEMLKLNLLLRSPPEFCHRRQQFAEDGTCLKPAWKRRWTKSSSKCNANMLSKPRRSGLKPMLMRGTRRMTLQNDLPRASQTGKSSRAKKSNKQDN